MADKLSKLNGELQAFQRALETHRADLARARKRYEKAKREQKSAPDDRQSYYEALLFTRHQDVVHFEEMVAGASGQIKAIKAEIHKLEHGQ